MFWETVSLYKSCPFIRNQLVLLDVRFPDIVVCHSLRWCVGKWGQLLLIFGEIHNYCECFQLIFLEMYHVCSTKEHTAVVGVLSHVRMWKC